MLGRYPRGELPENPSDESKNDDILEIARLPPRAWENPFKFPSFLFSSKM